MSKYITIYQPNALGEIEKIEMIDGEVVNGNPRTWGEVWRSWTGIVGGTEKPLTENGREYDPVSGWHYTAAANGDATSTSCDGEVAQDYQGSVPSWDGYDGD